MYTIVVKKKLADNVMEYVIDAPKIVRNAAAGQFVILRTHDNAERVPFTICDYDKAVGTITILVQEVGLATKRLSQMNAGDKLSDLVGPLGMPTDLTHYKNIILVGGGIGTAVIYPQAKFLASIGKNVDIIVGARTKNLVMYEREFAANCANLYITTDDGSYQRKGFVTDVLQELLVAKQHDCVFAVGPMGMMRAVSNLTQKHDVPCIVSMNSMMVDGTGMCGCCRLTVGGVTKYACVHGPEFDGHQVDWAEAINRSRAYCNEESDHKCRLV